jgi:Protein of unknown function (DUF3025)
MRNETWNPDFHSSLPLFDSIEPFFRHFLKYKNWPTLKQLNQLFIENKLSVKAVEQQGKPEKFDDHYESRIYLKGELQTRTENWHDFFNAMVWLGFPDIKKTLNELHYQTSHSREAGTNRSSLENAIALFDECGLIIISDQQDLLDLIRNHQWHEIFFDQKDAFDKHIRCITFGHAMFEKALNPYIGMTAHAVLIHSSELLNKDLMTINKTVANMWKYNEIQTSRDLQPVPILGIPGWCKFEQNEVFYSNADYFRPKKTS